MCRNETGWSPGCSLLFAFEIHCPTRGTLWPLWRYTFSVLVCCRFNLSLNLDKLYIVRKCPDCICTKHRIGSPCHCNTLWHNFITLVAVAPKVLKKKVLLHVFYSPFVPKNYLHFNHVCGAVTLVQYLSNSFWPFMVVKLIVLPVKADKVKGCNQKGCRAVTFFSSSGNIMFGSVHKNCD